MRQNRAAAQSYSTTSEAEISAKGEGIQATLL
jgi:hypothetical protein